MGSRQTCDRCGKALVAGVGPEGPVDMKTTGETICGDCLMALLESTSPNLADDIDARAFSSRLTADLSQQTGVPARCFSIVVKSFMSHDVEIKIAGNRYEIAILNDLASEPARYAPARDYLVAWVKDRPISAGEWAAVKSPNQTLVPGGRFVVIFLPEDFPEPPASFGNAASRELAGVPDGQNVGWMLCPVASNDEERRKRQMGGAMSAWAATQARPDSLRVNVKTVKFSFSPERCTCVVVQYAD